MKQHLNSNLEYIHNSKKNTGYILEKSGRCHVLNSDAMLLLNDYDKYKLTDNNYNGFFEMSKQLGWLMTDTNEGQSIRSISSTYHLKRVQLEILLRCNLKCEHCYCSSHPMASMGMSTDNVLKLIDELSEMGVMYLDITGGEPILRKDIFKVISYAQMKGLVVSIFSNATTINPSNVKRLKELNIASVQTSLDAFTPEIHDHFRGKKGAFRKSIEGIHLLKKNNIPTSVTVVVHQENKHEINKLANYISMELKVPFRLDRVIPSGRALSNDISVSNEEFYRILRQIPNSNKELATKVCDSSNAIINKSHIAPSCGVGESYLFIKNNGDVVLCPTMTEKEDPRFKSGNLLFESIKDIWENHPTFKEHREIQCQNINICPVANTCKGGCRSNAYLLHGSVSAPDELYCNLHKNKTSNYNPYIERYKTYGAH